jgi:hypothetical protein
MWGSWLGVTFTGLVVVLFLIAISIAASPLFAVLIAAAVGLAAAVVVIAQRVRQAGPGADAGTRNPRSGGAPASGEGSGSPTSPTGPAR